MARIKPLFFFYVINNSGNLILKFIKK